MSLAGSASNGNRVGLLGIRDSTPARRSAQSDTPFTGEHTDLRRPRHQT